MADENKETPAPNTGATPAFDPEKMRAMMREELQQALATDGKANDGVSFEQPAVTQPQPTVNPLQAIIDPIIAPHVQRANLASAAAQDAATFYVSHPEASKYQKEIEDIFQ